MSAAAADRRVALLYCYAQMQRPGLPLPLAVFRQHLARMHQRARATHADWDRFLADLFPLDALLAAACLENVPAAWETLFAARAGRADRLLVDALRQRAARLYPGDEVRQETAVSDFWGHLLLAPTAEATPILARYDGVRPLAPWLIRVFQNRQISQLRSPRERGETLADDDLLAGETPADDGRWADVFADCARAWLSALPADELLLLGLRWRFRLSQREIADMMKVHEGTVSRQVSALRDQALAAIGKGMEDHGWTGDDLAPLILREMAGVLLDEPRLSAGALARLLRARNQTVPRTGRMASE